jgi:maleylpyruvate isomerase
MGGIALSEIDVQSTVDSLATSTKRLLDNLSGLDDAAVHQPSALPDWNRAMVLTHLARNADAYRRLLEGTQRDEVVHMYPHGRQGRAADIDAGRYRSAIQLVEDVTEAAGLLAQTIGRMTPEAWEREGELFVGRMTAAQAVQTRRREVEIHHADLLLGYGPDDWPADFIVEQLEQVVEALGDRLPPSVAVQLITTDDLGEWWAWPSAGSPSEPVPIRATGGQLLAWLVGRSSTVTNAPQLKPWG